MDETTNLVKYVSVWKLKAVNEQRNFTLSFMVLKGKFKGEYLKHLSSIGFNQIHTFIFQA